MPTVEARLKAAGVELPTPSAPIANYVPVVQAAALAHVSGQIPLTDDRRFFGVVGGGLTLEQGQAAARLCAVNIIAQLMTALGDLDRVRRVVKLNVFVQADADFTAIPAVANGASDLMVEAFGDAGRHARSAVGVYRLPLGVAVEVDAVVQIA